MLPIDVQYGLKQHELDAQSYSDYITKLREHLRHAFELAQKHSKSSQTNHRHNYNKTLRGRSLQVGDHVLVRNKKVHFLDKLADKWEPGTYVVRGKSYDDLALNMVQAETEGRRRTLHRNFLLPITPPRLS